MKKSPSASASDAPPPSRAGLVVGLAGFLAWLVMGVVLEGLHAFKAVAYLEDPVRRLQWTLAHAHGTLLSLAAIVIGALVLPASRSGEGARRVADRLFATGAVVMPLGFLAGGAWHSEGDPGLGILLVPAGAIACASGVALALAGLLRKPQ